ncbi:MAG: hypothetical protein QNK37_27525 [Acidobacteriota bacterium]|nr:hypothetical protein [Acidobacteriota bacterium]
MVNLRENTIIPPRVAAAFAELMRLHGYNLDFSLETLGKDFDNLLANKDLHHVRVRLRGYVSEAVFDFETSAGCYLGQVLSRSYAGRWCGHCSPATGVSFYTLWLQFGEYRFFPIIYVAYRTGNGVESTGSVGSLLSALEPSMNDGIDYKRRQQDELQAEGRVVIDTTPWL